MLLLLDTIGSFLWLAISYLMGLKLILILDIKDNFSFGFLFGILAISGVIYIFKE